MVTALHWSVTPLEYAGEYTGEYSGEYAGESASTAWRTWDRLNDEHFGGHPMFASTMLRTLAHHFGGRDLLMACGRLGAQVYAQAVILPTGRGRWSLFCPSQTGVGALVFDRRMGGHIRLLAQLVRALPGFALELTLPYQDPSFAWSSAQRSWLLHEQHLGTTVAVHSPEGFEHYWSQRPKKLRDNVKRYIKRATEQGLPPRLVVTTDPAAISAAVDRYGELESRGWKGREGTAVHPTNTQGRFYRELMARFAQRNQAHVSELYLGERLAASRLVASGASMHVALKTTYDEELRAYAPGRIHRYFMTRELLGAHPIRPIEFYTKADHDALMWATHSRDLHTASVYRNSLVGRLAHFGRVLSSRRRRQQASTADAGPHAAEIHAQPAD